MPGITLPLTPLLICLVGQGQDSSKDLVAAYLAGQGFVLVSASEEPWVHVAQRILESGASVVLDGVDPLCDGELVSSMDGRIWLVDRPRDPEAAHEADPAAFGGINAVVLHSSGDLNDLFRTIGSLLLTTLALPRVPQGRGVLPAPLSTDIDSDVED